MEKMHDHDEMMHPPKLSSGFSRASELCLEPSGGRLGGRIKQLELSTAGFKAEGATV